MNERLETLRSKRGWSQKEIAERLGIARTTYSGYENGSREPDVKMFNKIAELFEVRVEWLIYGIERELEPEDEKLINSFSILKEEDQKYILKLMDRLKKE